MTNENFSTSGETAQDNDLIVIRERSAAAKFEAHFERVHFPRIRMNNARRRSQEAQKPMNFGLRALDFSKPLNLSINAACHVYPYRGTSEEASDERNSRVVARSQHSRPRRFTRRRLNTQSEFRMTHHFLLYPLLAILVALFYVARTSGKKPFMNFGQTPVQSTGAESASEQAKPPSGT